MIVTVDLPDELAIRLGTHKNQLPEILERGLRDVNASDQFGYNGAAAVLEFLAKLPTPEQIVAFRPSAALETHVNDLLEKNRTRGLTPEEKRQWEQYEYLENLVRTAKAEAFVRLKAA
jgi:hypothetical protein